MAGVNWLAAWKPSDGGKMRLPAPKNMPNSIRPICKPFLNIKSKPLSQRQQRCSAGITTLSILRGFGDAVKHVTASVLGKFRIAQCLLLCLADGDLAVDEADEAGFLEFCDAAVHGLDARADVVGNLLAARVQDEEIGVDVAEPLEQVMLEAFEARLELDTAVLVGGRVHLGGEQPGNGEREVVVKLHPLQEGFGCHGNDFTGGQGLVRRREYGLVSQYLEVAYEVWHILAGKGVTLATGKFVADARAALGQDIDVVGAFSLADNGFAGQEDAAARLALDFFRHMLQHIVELHSK